jgi:hypothetical protein
MKKESKMEKIKQEDIMEAKVVGIANNVMRIEWAVNNIGWGQLDFLMDENGLLILSETMDRDFVKSILNYVIDHSKLDYEI